MSKPASVAVIIGSLRKSSFSRKVAQALIARAPASLACRIVEIGDLSLHNEDLDADPPKSWGRFRSDIADADADPLAAIVTRRDPTTFFSPKGDHQSGAGAIAKRYGEDPKTFGKPGKSRIEVRQSGASGGLAFWTGVQHAEVRIAGKDKPVRMTLRITEAFRLESREWALVRRHADMAQGDRQ